MGVHEDIVQYAKDIEEYQSDKSYDQVIHSLLLDCKHAIKTIQDDRETFQRDENELSRPEAIKQAFTDLFRSRDEMHEVFQKRIDRADKLLERSLSLLFRLLGDANNSN